MFIAEREGSEPLLFISVYISLLAFIILLPVTNL